MTAEVIHDGIKRDLTRHDVWRMIHRADSPAVVDADRRRRLLGTYRVPGTLWIRLRDASAPHETSATCPTCYGVGSLAFGGDDDQHALWEPCPDCSGSGRAPYVRRYDGELTPRGTR